MTKPFTLERIEAAKAKVEEAQHGYLRRFGWELTCHSPGSYWVWRRDFADVDARDRAWWEETKAKVEAATPPRQPPSEPRAYGVRFLPTDMAIGATIQLLDHDRERRSRGDHRQGSRAGRI